MNASTLEARGEEAGEDLPGNCWLDPPHFFSRLVWRTENERVYLEARGKGQEKTRLEVVGQVLQVGEGHERLPDGQDEGEAVQRGAVQVGDAAQQGPRHAGAQAVQHQGVGVGVGADVDWTHRPILEDVVHLK